MHFRVTIDYTEIDQTRGKIGMIVKLPLGITVREDLSCSAVGYNQCRVNYRCDFDLPTGGRGAIVRLLLRRELNFGPADSLTRLKRAAELQVCGVNLLL